MNTECNQFVSGFHPLKRREIRAQFDGGAITSDGGATAPSLVLRRRCRLGRPTRASTIPVRALESCL